MEAIWQLHTIIVMNSCHSGYTVIPIVKVVWVETDTKMTPWENVISHCGNSGNVNMGILVNPLMGIAPLSQGCESTMGMTLDPLQFPSLGIGYFLGIS